MMRPANNLGIALAAAVTSIVGGTILFQASALAYDYMKLQKLPLYGSGASLPEFSDTLSSLIHEMDGPTAVIRGVIRERGTIDLVVADKASAAKNAITDARAYLRENLNSEEQAKVGFKATGLSFTETDAIFQKICPAADNIVANKEMAPLDVANSAPEPAPTSASNGDAVLAAHPSAFTEACHIDVGTYCTEGVPDPKAGPRAQSICAQKALQTALRRKGAITSFDYDAAQYITDILHLTYPGFSKTDVANAINVASAYRALARKPLNVGGRPASGANSASTASPGAAAVARDAAASTATTEPPPIPPAPNIFAPFWNFLLAIPLAVLYLALSFMFGGIGSIANYLYATAAPDSVAKTPSVAPWYPVVAGGGAAILVLLVVMAGFQFLTIGAATPDLAYPNPLTVCGLSVLVGLSGDRFLTALRAWLGRLFGPSDGGAVVDKGVADTGGGKKDQIAEPVGGAKTEV